MNQFKSDLEVGLISSCDTLLLLKNYPHILASSNVLTTLIPNLKSSSNNNTTNNNNSNLLLTNITSPTELNQCISALQQIQMEYKNNIDKEKLIWEDTKKEKAGLEALHKQITDRLLVEETKSSNLEIELQQGLNVCVTELNEIRTQYMLYLDDKDEQTPLYQPNETVTVTNFIEKLNTIVEYATEFKSIQTSSRYIKKHFSKMIKKQTNPCCPLCNSNNMNKEIYEKNVLEICTKIESNAKKTPQEYNDSIEKLKLLLTKIQKSEYANQSKTNIEIEIASLTTQKNDQLAPRIIQLETLEKNSKESIKNLEQTLTNIDKTNSVYKDLNMKWTSLVSRTNELAEKKKRSVQNSSMISGMDFTQGTGKICG